MDKNCSTCGRWGPNVYDGYEIRGLGETEGYCASFNLITDKIAWCDTLWKEADPWDIEDRKRGNLIAEDDISFSDYFARLMPWWNRVRNVTRRTESTQVERKPRSGSGGQDDKFDYK